MSVSVGRIFCSQCDYRSNTSVAWGHYFYTLTDGQRLSLQRSLSWCRDCSDCVPVEDFSDRQWMDNSIIKLETQLRAIQNSWVNRCKSFFGRPPSSQNYLYDELTELKVRREFLRERESPPRCLRCGSTEIIQFDYSSPAEAGPPVPLDFTHPNCNGQLLIENDGLRIAMKFTSNMVYDFEGKFIERERFSEI